ncbi:MAG: AAA family ATPase [bacterium]
MKDLFVTTKNVKRFQAVMDRIHRQLKGMPRMGLIFGQPGLGKTECALQYAASNNGGFQNTVLYIRMKKLMNARWFLIQLLHDLQAPVRWRTMDLFSEAERTLKERGCTLILDEVDYFSSDSKVTETLRDLHDLTQIPMLFLGMEHADKRLMRYPHLYDRFVEVFKFMPLDHEDVEKMTKELSEFQFSDEAIDRIARDSEGKVRKILILIHRAEYVARGLKGKTIEAKDLR